MSERGGQAMVVCYTLAPRFRGVGIDDCGVSGKTPQRSEPYFTPITAPSTREGDGGNSELLKAFQTWQTPYPASKKTNICSGRG